MINWRDEKLIYVTLGLAVLFFWLAFDKWFGTVLTIMLIIDWQMYQDSKGMVVLTFAKPVSTMKDNAVMIGLFAGFLITTYLIGSALFPQSFTSLFSVFTVYSESMPPLAGNAIMYIIGQGVIVGIIETRLFFQRLPEFLAKRFGIQFRFDISNPKMWTLFAVASAAFVMFHIGVKAITQSDVLFSTFVFGMFSCICVFYFKQGREAQALHVANNIPAAIRYLISIGGLTL